VWLRLDVEVRCDKDVSGRILPMAKAYIGISYLYPVPTWAAPRAENSRHRHGSSYTCKGGCSAGCYSAQ
jgi:hypothetical protein